MGDRLPEDAYAYHYEDPICTMESRYWNFILENYILSANEIYNHCLTTQDVGHTWEMVTVTQNLAYDFCYLTEYLKLRQSGINVPVPTRNTFNIKPASDFYEPEQLVRSPPKCKTKHSNDGFTQKNKKGINVKAPPFIPSVRSETHLQQQQRPDLQENREINQDIQQLPADGRQQRIPQQTWAQIVPQLLPHYHIPFTNLIHYPIGNIFTHQISRSYRTYGDVEVHHNNKLTRDCSNPIISNPPEEHVNHGENPVAHTGVQVELSADNSHLSSEDVELTQEEINVNKLINSSPYTSDSRDSEEKITPPPETLDNAQIFDENADNLIEKRSTNLNLETMKTKTHCSTPIKQLLCEQVEDEFKKYEKSDEEETISQIKSTYKDVLMKGISSLEKVEKETTQQEAAESVKADEWKQVIRRKSSNLDVKSCGSANRYNTAKKSLFSKFAKKGQSLQEVYPKTTKTFYNRTANRGLTQNRSQSTNKWQDVYLQEPRVDDEEEVEEKYDDVKIVKQPTLTFNNKLTKTSDDIDANSSNILLLNKNNKINQETNLIEEFEKNLTIEFNEPLQISIKPKEWQIRKISTKKRRNNGDLNICDPQITDESNVSQMDSSIEETNIESNVNAEMCMDGSQEYSKSSDNIETTETSDDPLSLLTSESPPSYELSCSPDRLIGSETLMHDNTVTKIFDTNPAAGLYVSCDQNVDDDEYENAMLQLLSPTNASFYDFLSSITPENTDSKENYRQLFNDFTEYFNSLPVTAQKEEMDILRKIFFENVEVACNFRISTIEEFELLFAENPNAASQLENHINSKLRQIRESETKQQLAYEKRLQLLQCKTARVREQVQKVEEAKAAKYKLALQRKSQIDLKLKKAEENRKMYLSIIRKKAHDEEEKLKEIAFINELEAQNRRHDSLALRQEHEGRLQILIEERQRRLEEKAAKEAAVEERRRILEAERQEKLEKMKEKRRRKEEIIDRKQQEREKERLVIAREKAREREERLQARKEAHLATVEELQKRIQQKQEESARRHEENIELIRQKALEVGLHRSILDDANHQEDTEAISNLPKDKSKINVKRRYKKIRARLMQRGDEFLRKCNFIQQDLMSLNCGPLVEMINELSSFAVDDLLLVENNVHTVERMLTEVSLIMERKADALVLYIFIFSKGIVILGKFLEAFIHLPAKKVSVYKWILEKIIKIYNLLVHEDSDGFKYVVGSNGLMLLFELLNYSVGMLTTNMKFFPELTEKILITSKIALKNMSLTSDSETSLPYYKSLIADLISYILTCGLTTKIPELFQIAVISEGGQLNDLIPKFVDFLAALVHKSFLSAELIRTLKATVCLGTVPLLYEGIQKMSPAKMSLPIYARSVIQLLLSFAKLDIGAFQETLGAEGMALQMRAIASLLMSYCSVNPDYDNMLQDVIEMVGYFAVYNLENQSLIQSGQQPTILQQLVSLPFNYFCDPRYKWKLFPTLIVCSHNNSTNRAIVENECSYRELESFIETPNIEDEIPLLKIFLDKRRQENGDAAIENPSAQQ